MRFLTSGILAIAGRSSFAGGHIAVGSSEFQHR
jgi:hypothetical protein